MTYWWFRDYARRDHTPNLSRHNVSIARQITFRDLYRLNLGGLKVTRCAFPSAAEVHREDGAGVVGQVRGLGAAAVKLGDQADDVQAQAEMRALVAFRTRLPQ